MNQRPSILVSCVSHEFSQIPSRVAAILARLGYTPVFQEVFGTEPDDLRWVARDKIDVCEGLQPDCFPLLLLEDPTVVGVHHRCSVP